MLGGLLSAGAQIIGGLLGKSSADSANRHADEMNARNIKLQREFAQSGIRWKVEDAKAAGIHPLYAIGAPTASYSPVSVGHVADTSMAAAWANAGQDVSRAINATRTDGERDAAFASTYEALQLENMGLQNDLLASQIAKLNAAPNPPFPGSGVDAPENRPTIRIGGREWKTDPNTSNSDEISRRLGEPGEWIAAPAILWEDYKKNNPGSWLTYLDNTTPRQNLRDLQKWWQSTRKTPVGRRKRGWRN